MVLSSLHLIVLAATVAAGCGGLSATPLAGGSSSLPTRTQSSPDRTHSPAAATPSKEPSARPSEASEAPVPAPSGMIAFGVTDTVTGEVHMEIIRPDGTLVRRIDAAGAARWSPSGDRLLTGTELLGGQIGTAIMNPDGTGKVVLPLPDHTLNLVCGAWSPDAMRIACEGWDDADKSRAGVYTMRIDGSELVRVTSNDTGSNDIPGDYSPDGVWIAFVRAADATGARPAVFVVPVVGGEPRRVTPLGTSDCCVVRWAPDGSKLLSDAGPLFTVNPDGSDLTAISLERFGIDGIAFAPAWSPDGRWVVFSYTQPGSKEVDLWLARSDGTNLVQLTDTSHVEEFVDWTAADSP